MPGWRDTSLVSILMKRILFDQITLFVFEYELGKDELKTTRAVKLRLEGGCSVKLLVWHFAKEA